MSLFVQWILGVCVALFCLYLTSLLQEDTERVCRNCYHSRKSTSTGSYQGYFCLKRKQEVKPWNTCKQFMEREQE